MPPQHQEEDFPETAALWDLISSQEVPNGVSADGAGMKVPIYQEIQLLAFALGQWGEKTKKNKTNRKKYIKQRRNSNNNGTFTPVIGCHHCSELWRCATSEARSFLERSFTTITSRFSDRVAFCVGNQGWVKRTQSCRFERDLTHERSRGSGHVSAHASVDESAHKSCLSCADLLLEGTHSSASTRLLTLECSHSSAHANVHEVVWSYLIWSVFTCSAPHPRQLAMKSNTSTSSSQWVSQIKQLRMTMNTPF